MKKYINYFPGECIELKKNCNCGNFRPDKCKNISPFENCFDNFTPFPPVTPLLPPKHKPKKDFYCKNNSLMLFISGLLIGQLFNCDDD